jgi:hypothetical protein
MGEILALEQPRTLLSPYENGLFVGHRGWVVLSQILESRGAGSYALSGPRGAGKSWAMERALESVKGRGGLGVWFPSPSEYEPIAFLSALSEQVAVEFESYYDEKTGRSTKAARARFFWLYFGGTLIAYLGAILYVFGNTEGEGGRLPSFVTGLNVLVASLVIGGLSLMVYAMRRRRRDREGLGRVRVKAEELRRQVRFSITATDRNEVGIGGKLSGFEGLLKRARERQLVERPATLSSLIHSFRAFVKDAAKEIDGPVVIAVDELDKMSDGAAVAQLLRDIKGIFEIDGTCFLVSISDEAAQALELGALRARNEFNSSFYTVISMPSLNPAESMELLRQRDHGYPSACGRLIGILTGGVSREVVRVADSVRVVAGIEPTVVEAAAVILEEELEAFGSRICQTANSYGDLRSLGDEARVSACAAIERGRSTLGNGSHNEVFADWDLNSRSDIWMRNFAEEWRRLVVRLAVVAEIQADPPIVENDADAERLQQVIRDAAASAAVGRWRLERGRSPLEVKGRKLCGRLRGH